MLQETETQYNSQIQARSRRHCETREQGEEIEESEDEDMDSPDSERRLTLSRYAAFRLCSRLNEPNVLLRGGRLLTRFVVDIFASMDQQQLGYISHNQSKFCLTWLNNLEDANMADPDNLDVIIRYVSDFLMPYVISESLPIIQSHKKK